MEALVASYRVPVIDLWKGNYSVWDGNQVNPISEFIEEAQALEGEEGYVIRFNDGHMLKVKNPWYMQLHKVKALLEFEKDVWALVLNDKQDDLKSIMEDEDKVLIDEFSEKFFNCLTTVAERLEWIVIAAKDNLNNSKKRFALEIIPQHSQLEKGLLFHIWDGVDALEALKELVLKHTKTQTKIDHIRPLLGDIKWVRYITEE